MRKVWRRLPPSWRGRLRVGARAAIALVARARAGRSRRGRPGPLVVAGLFSSPSGLGESARGFADALTAAGLDVRRWDVTTLCGHASELSIEAACDLPPCNGGAVLYHVNPWEFLQLVARRGGRAVDGRPRIAYWAWELPRAPRDWRPAFALVDEVWCTSQFTASALQPLSSRPVRVIGHPLHAATEGVRDRGGFGLADDEVVVLCVFDLRSTLARKNPLGAIAMFRQACEAVPPTARARLVLKISGAEAQPAALSRVLAAVEGLPVTIVTEALSPRRMSDLIRTADIVLAPHRAEGFGLVPAAALRAGRALVTTGWSGVMDFIDETSADLVPHDLVAVDDPQALYSGGVWAEPSIDHGAALLRRLILDQEARDALGAAAARRAAVVFDGNAWTGRVLERLRRLGVIDPPGA